MTITNRLRSRKQSSKQGVASSARRRYSAGVTVNPVTGFGSPNKLAQQRPKSIARRFFTPAATLYGGCVWEGFGPAGCQLSRSTNLHTVATQSCLVAGSGGSSAKVGAPPMHHIPARNPSALQDRAAAHRAMALAALRANSSLSVRLKRYNHHQTIARDLEAMEAQGGAQ